MAAVLDALASYIQNMLTEMVTEEVRTLLGVSGEIHKMGSKLADLKNFVADADRRNITDQRVQEWVRELKNAMYDMTDILDLCQLKVMEQGPRHDAGCFNALHFCIRNPLHAHNIGNQIKNLNSRLEEIKKRSEDFGFIDLSSYEECSRRVTSSNLTSHETSSELDESSLVGEKIEEDTRALVDMLTNKELKNHGDKKITIFAIVGVGGIGKTTLAQNIFNHDTIQQVFQKKVWLSVNENIVDVELLRRAIIEAGGDHQQVGNTKGALQRSLKESLNGLKTLLVMDDVWDHQAWERVLRTPLVNALGQGSCVLVTTRHDMVARGMMAEEPYHHIDKLRPEDAWSLLRKQVVGNTTDESQIEMLMDIGMSIIFKCDFLPLAIKVMGGLLRHKRTRREWENVALDSIWSVSSMPQELNHAIYLSYKYLHPNLKSCFLHYSLLPKSALFYVSDIVGMWISEGFVYGIHTDLEELGREYYDELIQRNLIEPDKSYTDQSVCNMHDVVRSFGQCLARDEALVLHSSGIDITDKLHSQKFIRLSLEAKGSLSNELEWKSLQKQMSLRTLISVGHGHIKIKPGDSLRSPSSLRTLHIEDVNFDDLIESLDHLRHLRYLSIRNTSTSRLPENIAKMKFLECINLAGCNRMVKLPTSIVKLPQLRYLGLTGTSINAIPKGFAGLTSLRKLYGFPAHMDGDWCSLQELGPLCKLIHLEVFGLQNISSSTHAIRARLHEKVRLSFLHLYTSRFGDDGRLLEVEEGTFENGHQEIQEVFDGLCPPPCLENLGITGYFGLRLPRWLMLTADAPLWNLRNLTMDNLPCCTELPNGLCHLPFLELLQIQRAPEIKLIGSEFLEPKHCHLHSQVGVAFARMRLLNFNTMVEWEEWEWEAQAKAMPMLEYITFQRCKLKRIPPGLTFHAKALKKLHIYNVKQLSCLENFVSVVHLDLFENPDLERVSNLPKLKILNITRCPTLRLLEGMTALHRLNLQDCDVETVPRYMKDIKPRHLQIYCSLSLLTSIASRESSPEWDKFSHIQQVKGYAHDDSSPRIWYVLYIRHPFRFETNISNSAIAQARSNRTYFRFFVTCPIEYEGPVGQQRLCSRFRWQAYNRLFFWLRRVCPHCREAAGAAPQ